MKVTTIFKRAEQPIEKVTIELDSSEAHDLAMLVCLSGSFKLFSCMALNGRTTTDFFGLIANMRESLSSFIKPIES